MCSSEKLQNMPVLCQDRCRSFARFRLAVAAGRPAASLGAALRHRGWR